MPSNKDERDILVQILGYCGVLNPAGYSSGPPTFGVDAMCSTTSFLQWQYNLYGWFCNVTMLDDREIPYVIGRLCDGFDISVEQRALMMAALVGVVLTNRGPRLYYADLDTMMLQNVDTEEGIWSTAEDGVVRGMGGVVLVDLHHDRAARQHGLFPLAVVGNDARMAWWTEAMAHAGNAERRRWAKFVRRVLKPLQQALGQSAR